MASITVNTTLPTKNTLDRITAHNSLVRDIAAVLDTARPFELERLVIDVEYKSSEPDCIEFEILPLGADVFNCKLIGPIIQLFRRRRCATGNANLSYANLSNANLSNPDMSIPVQYCYGNYYYRIEDLRAAGFVYRIPGFSYTYSITHQSDAKLVLGRIGD